MISLNGKWKLYPVEHLKTVNSPIALSELEHIDATVPGNVELDLIEAGKLPKGIYHGMNITLAEKYETFTWWYEKDFVTPEFSNRLIIKFEGVDCFAEYLLNGRKFGESKNSLIEHQFDITDFVNPSGEANKLQVYIKSTLREINKMPSDFHELTGWGRGEFTNVRKQAHSFGWDILPRALSAGIWRSVSVYDKPLVDISQFQCITKSVNNKKAELLFLYELDIDDTLVGKTYEITINGKCKNSEFTFKDTFNTKLGKLGEKYIKNPYLWWPSGYGEANMYKITVTVTMNGKIVAETTIDTGIRTVELKRTATTNGTDGDFRFVINGADIMCRGTNWVPMDVYHSRDSKRYAKALEMVSDLGCNIIRCWGGNVYEEQGFYDYCNKNGIMIWQDFGMACAAYSHSEEFCKQLFEEATQIVRKFRNNPCIILWAGDNECDAVYAANGTNPDENILTRHTLKEVCRLNDFSRPYLPSSPYYEGVFKNDQDGVIEGREISERHLWGPRDYFKSDFYKQAKCHFVSEIGYHGCPDVESLEKFIDKEFMWPDILNEQWTLHSSDQKNSPHRIELMTSQIKQFFNFAPETLEEYSKASQYVQAEAKKYFIEMIRCKKPVRTGVIWWNLIDGWPQISDAVVDYYYNKKEAYEYIKRSQKPVMIILDELCNLKQKIVAVNDTMQKANGTHKIYDIDTSLVYAEGDFDIGENGAEILGEIHMDISEKKFLVIEWNVNGVTHYNHYLCGCPTFDFKQYHQWIEKFKRIIG